MLTDLFPPPVFSPLGLICVQSLFTAQPVRYGCAPPQRRPFCPPGLQKLPLFFSPMLNLSIGIFFLLFFGHPFFHTTVLSIEFLRTQPTTHLLVLLTPFPPPPSSFRGQKAPAQPHYEPIFGFSVFPGIHLVIVRWHFFDFFFTSWGVIDPLFSMLVPFSLAYHLIRSPSLALNFRLSTSFAKDVPLASWTATPLLSFPNRQKGERAFSPILFLPPIPICICSFDISENEPLSIFVFFCSLLIRFNVPVLTFPLQRWFNPPPSETRGRGFRDPQVLPRVSRICTVLFCPPREAEARVPGPPPRP